MNPAPALAYARRHRARFVDELKRLVRFPTISSNPENSRDLSACARWLAVHLRTIGLRDVRIVPTRHHPIVYASWRGAAGAPTLLVYGHYDVQPAEPVAEWRVPPFQPMIRGHRLFGRGASDDKGQLFTHLKAIESWLRTAGRLPVNVKCIFEGDEERGSPDLESFVARNSAALRACGALISDTRMIAPNRPTIGYAERGNVRFQLEVCGAARELHSGNFGGAVPNPLEGLATILASLHDRDGRIGVRDFYNQVRDWRASERAYMKRAGPSDTRILRDAGAAGSISKSWGEPGFTLYERITIRPALTVNSISGGYSGPGIKSVIPSRAAAKFSIRTVPDQTAAAVEEAIRKHIRQVTPEGLTSQLRVLGATDPVVVDRNHPLLRAASLACEKGFGATPVFLRSGGSIGGASVFSKVLGIPSMLMGFALPEDNVHAPNESFDLCNFFRGIETSIWFLAVVARLRACDRPHAKPESPRELEAYDAAYDY